MNNPAQEGIDQAIEEANKEQFISTKIDEFKMFVIDGMREGHHHNFADHNAFLRACLEVWIDMCEEE